MIAPAPIPPGRPGAVRKLAVVLAIAAFTTGASGYFMGLRQTEATAAHRLGLSRGVPDAVPPANRGAESPGYHDGAVAAPPAPAYRDLRDRSRQPNHAWRSELSTLPPPPPFTAESPRPGAVELAALSERRTARRAYAGAPPVVPHPIDQRESASCLACHGRPTRIGAVDVPQMSHALHSQCIQCHAPAAGPGRGFHRVEPPALLVGRRSGESGGAPVSNSFSGVAPVPRGTRAYAGAPPTMPHGVAMRQNCVTCHGPGGSSIVKTTHPQRQNCLQCHATDARRETLPQIEAGGPPAVQLPPPTVVLSLP